MVYQRLAAAEQYDIFTPPALSLVSKKIRDESLPILFSEATFTFTMVIGDDDKPCEIPVNHLDYIVGMSQDGGTGSGGSLSYLTLIENVEVEFVFVDEALEPTTALKFYMSSTRETLTRLGCCDAADHPFVMGWIADLADILHAVTFIEALVQEHIEKCDEEGFRTGPNLMVGDNDNLGMVLMMCYMAFPQATRSIGYDWVLHV